MIRFDLKSHRGWLLLALVALATLSFDAAPLRAALGGVTSVSQDGDTLTVAIGGDQLIVQACTPDMLKVDYLPNGKSSPDTPSIYTTHWKPIGASIDTSSNPMTITTSKLVVRINKTPCRISVCDIKQNPLIAEQDSEGVYDGGIHFSTIPGSHFYGLKGWEYLDNSKGQMEMFPSTEAYHIKAGSEGNTGGPLIWSNKGFGVYVDTDRGYCQIPSSTALHIYQISKANVEYYIMVGDPYDIQRSVAELTGRPPMFPKWALGFANSEFTIMNEDICLKNVEGYRSRGIPFDLYVFDFQWKAWGEDNYGEWRWNPSNFPHGPSGSFKEKMDAKGVKLAGIMKPRIHVDTVQGQYATAHGFWVPERKPYLDYFSGEKVNDLDLSKAECRQWYWDHAKAAWDSGIVGWWNDEADAWGDTWEGMYMQKTLYEGQRAYTNGQKRVWSINRNFYSGSQRYAYGTWSGDIESGFAVMQQQRERLMCSLNIGQARWGMDTGGFNNHNNISGEEYSESYARWMEFAAFVPIFRTHGTTYHQPWLFGLRSEAAAKKAIRLRYSLIPYMYSYERLLNETGIGLCRPLVWDHPDDPKCFNNVDAWMFGQYLLVAPIVENHQACKNIYLPRGSWIDYFRGTRYTGPQTISYGIDPSSWDDIPLFVRSGAIIPSMDVTNYVGETPLTVVYVDVFADSTPTSFKYYDDDGTTYDYERGGYCEQIMTAQDRGEWISFKITDRTGTYTPALKYYICRIHGRAATNVTVNGSQATKYNTYGEMMAGSAEGWTTGVDIYGNVSQVKVEAGGAKSIQVIGERAAPSPNGR